MLCFTVLIACLSTSLPHLYCLLYDFTCFNVYLVVCLCVCRYFSLTLHGLVHILPFTVFCPHYPPYDCFIILFTICSIKKWCGKKYKQYSGGYSEVKYILLCLFYYLTHQQSHSLPDYIPSYFLLIIWRIQYLTIMFYVLIYEWNIILPCVTSLYVPRPGASDDILLLPSFIR